MKKMKKIISILIAAVLLLSLFSCGKPSDESGDGSLAFSPEFPSEKEEDAEKITITLKELLELSNKSWTFSELISRLFPKYIAYTNGEGMLDVAKKLGDIKMADYDYSKMKADENGFRQYYGDDGERKSLAGMDVSAYQGYIDWEMVAESGIEFAFIRLGYRGYTEGKLIEDERFKSNIEDAIKNKIPVGVYFVTQAVSEKEAEEEAEYVLDLIKDYDVTWPIVYDVEGNAASDARARNNTPEQNTKNIIAFCEKIKAAGYTPMIYSNTRWFVSEMDITQLQDYDMWFAYYRETPFYPYDFQIWQYSDSGSVRGVQGYVDLNMSFIDYGAR